MNELLIITLLVWNVHGLPFPYLTGGADARLVAREVSQVPHDIFFGQEVWSPIMALELDYQTRPNAWKSAQWQAGLLIVSDSIPKVSYEEHVFEKNTFSKWDWISRKGFQMFVGPRATLFVNTHLDSGADMASQTARMYQAAAIVEEVRAHQGPVVIAGDLNLRRGKENRGIDEGVLRWLLSELDLRVAIKRKLDYVLVSRGIEVISKATLVSEHSDHRPLLVELGIR